MNIICSQNGGIINLTHCVTWLSQALGLGVGFFVTPLAGLVGVGVWTSDPIGHS